MDLPRSIDTSDPHGEVFSKASGLIPPRWLCRHTTRGSRQILALTTRALAEVHTFRLASDLQLVFFILASRLRR